MGSEQSCDKTDHIVGQPFSWTTLAQGTPTRLWRSTYMFLDQDNDGLDSVQERFDTVK